MRFETDISRVLVMNTSETESVVAFIHHTVHLTTCSLGLSVSSSPEDNISVSNDETLLSRVRVSHVPIESVHE